MSTGGPNTQRFSPFTPPLRGSFPLDRDHVCNPLVHDYIACLRQYNLKSKPAVTAKEEPSTSSDSINIGGDNSDSGSEVCRPLAKLYLECRMKAGLMTEEDVKSLGF